MRPRPLFPLFLLLSGCAAVPTTGNREPQAVPPAEIIDAHAHFDDDKSGPTEHMLEALRKAGVVGMVIHAPRKSAPQEVKRDTPVKIAYCAALAPPRSPREVEQGLKAGKYQCMKVYLAYVPRWASDPYYVPFYKLAEKYKVPVIFHTGDPYDKDAPVKYADPLTIDEIAIRYRRVNFILAHLGNPWIQSAAEVVYKNDNVYADTSAVMIGDVGKASPEAIDELIVKPIRWFWHYVENPKKMLFGSDWPLAEVAPYAAAIRKAIPPDHWQDVFHDNAVRVFPSLSSR